MNTRPYLVSLVATVAALALPPSADAALFRRAPKAHPTYSAVVSEGNKDGDTLYITKSNGQKTKVRIASVDTPECSHNSKEKDQPYGPEARDLTAKLAAGKKVHVEEVGTYPWPPFDPVVEITLPDGSNLGDDLIKAGAAEVDPRYKPTAIRLDEQKAAKAAGKGLWADENPIPPWTWRKDGDAKK